MKSFGKKAISLTLAFCLLCGLIPAAVFAKDPQDAYDYKIGVYHYTSNEKGEDGSYNTEDAFIWSDGWFLSDGTSLNSHLAALSAVAAITTAGYTADDPGLSGEERFADRDRNVKEFLATMGFEDYACNGYYHTNRLPNSAGCALARKTVTDKKGDKYTLLAILPMSANYRNEWAGNFDVGAAEDDEGNGLHHGFKAGCDEILRFTKKYVKDNSITGEIKIWTAGHSRGSALANLIGAFFAAGGADYFENGLTVSPEDIYCYTFATPGTVAGKTTKARLLSVEGARGGDYAGRDTAGDAYAYAGENAVLIPDSSLFDCVHNCRPDYDLITLLPPFIGWNFTVFGKNDLPIGSKELKPAMLKHLEKADPAVYKAFTEKVTLASLLETDADGDADSYEFKKLVLDGILPSIVSDGSYSMADMLASRIDGLRAIMPDRSSYVEKYQETFAAAMGIYGMAWEEFSGSFDLSDLAPVVLNYLEYAAERFKAERDSDETSAAVDACAEIIADLYLYLTNQGIIADAPDNITVRNLAERLAEFVLAAMSLIDETTVAKYGLDELASLLADKNYDGFFAAALEKIPDDKKDLVRALFSDAEGKLLNGGKTIKEAVSAVLPLALKEGDTARPLADAAREDLAALIDALKEKTLEAYAKTEHTEEFFDLQLKSNFDTIKNSIPRLREIIMNMLCRTNKDFSFKDELRTLVTFITQAHKIGFAHYNELYIAWMRAADTALVLGDLPSGELEDAALHFLSASSELRYTTDGTTPTASSPLYDGSVVFPAPAENCAAHYTVTALPFESGEQAGPAQVIGVYTATTAPEAVSVTETSITVYGVYDQEYVLTQKYVNPKWEYAAVPDKNGTVVFAGLDPNTQYTVHTRIAAGSGENNNAVKTTDFKTAKHLEPVTGDFIPGGTVTIEPASTDPVAMVFWFTAPDGEGAPETYNSLDMSFGASLTVPESAAGYRIYAQAYSMSFSVIGEGVTPLIKYGEVTFKSEGENVPEPVTGLKFGDKVAKPASDPIFEGYTFDGWYINEELTSPYDFDEGVKGSFTLYAKFAPNTYTLTVVDGTADSGQYKTGEKVTVKAGAAPAGMKFDKWTGDGVVFENAASAETTFTMPGKDATVTATFKKKPSSSGSSSGSYYSAPTADASTAAPGTAAGATTGAGRPFADVKDSDWYYGAVYECFDKGYFKGVSETSFAPSGNMTRAMFCTVLYRMAGEPKTEGKNPFADVKAGTWYADAVLWAYEKGVASGYGNGVFGVNDPVTREQAVTLLWRLSSKPAGDRSSLSSFSDADKISDWALDAFAWAAGVKIISGKGGGVLDPKAFALRSEIAQTVINYGRLRAE